MARTTANAVKGVLISDYGEDKDGNLPSLDPFIRSANVLVNRVATCATSRGHALTSEELELIERWLAAFFYTRSDPIYASKNTEGGGASFVSDPVDPERYRAAAVALDSSGCLAAILKGNRAGAAWLGRVPSEQTAYEDRD